MYQRHLCACPAREHNTERLAFLPTTSIVMNVDISWLWDLALAVQLFLAAVFVLFVYKVLRTSKRDAAGPEYRSVAIVVLGDIGRSPRMMYHAQSFAGHSFMTYIIAYRGKSPCP